MNDVVATSFPLPLTIAEINREWLVSALRTRAPEAGLRGFSIVKIVHGTCTKVHLHLQLDEAGRRAGISEYMILKGGFEPHSQDMDFMHGLEVRSYREVLPVLNLPSPTCYFAEFNPDQRQGIVLMEDLNASGATLCHPLRPHQPDDVARRLVELARFHAKTWGSPELEPGGRWGWANVLIPSGGGHLAQFLEPVAWQSCVDLPRGRAVSVYFQDLDWMKQALERLVILAARLPHALLHGDTHLGNLYVDRNGRPGFFDSLPHRWPAIEEIAYHIGGALDPLDRRKSERGLIGGYLDELDRNGVAVPSLEDMMQYYAAFLAFGFCIFMINASTYQTEAVNTAYTARFSAAMIDNDTIAALMAIA